MHLQGRSDWLSILTSYVDFMLRYSIKYMYLFDKPYIPGPWAHFKKQRHWIFGSRLFHFFPFRMDSLCNHYSAVLSVERLAIQCYNDVIFHVRIIKKKKKVVSFLVEMALVYDTGF